MNEQLLITNKSIDTCINDIIFLFSGVMYNLFYQLSTNINIDEIMQEEWKDILYETIDRWNDENSEKTVGESLIETLQIVFCEKYLKSYNFDNVLTEEEVNTLYLYAPCNVLKECYRLINLLTILIDLYNYNQLNLLDITIVYKKINLLLIGMTSTKYSLNYLKQLAEEIKTDLSIKTKNYNTDNIAYLVLPNKQKIVE